MIKKRTTKKVKSPKGKKSIKKPKVKKVKVTPKRPPKKKKVVVKKPTPKKKIVTKKPKKATKPIVQPTAIEKKPVRVVVGEQKRGSAPLVIEPYPKEYTGLPFLTLIQFRKQPMLVIIDNVDDEAIRAYVLDMCGPERVDEERIILVASEWFQENKTKYPLSIEFSKRGMTNETGRIYRTFDVEFVSRVIGPAPAFPMDTIKSVKRRRRKAVPQGVEVVARSAIS